MDYDKLKSLFGGSNFNVKLSTYGINDVSSDSINITDINTDMKGGFMGLFENDGNNLVLTAFEDNRPDVAAWLLNQGVFDNCDTVGKKGKAVIHYLGIYSLTNLVLRNIFVELLNNDKIKGCLKVQDEEGNTVLHYVVSDAQLVELLIKSGADKSIKNKDGFSVATESEQVPSDNVKRENNNVKQEDDNVKQENGNVQEYKITGLLELDNDNKTVPTNVVRQVSDESKQEADTESVFMKTDEAPTMMQKLNNLVGNLMKQTETLDSAESVLNRTDAPTKTEEQQGGSDTEININTDQFISEVLAKFKSQNMSEQKGGYKKRVVAGSRKMNTYSELSFGGNSESAISDISEMARMIKSQSSEVHERVVKKIMEIMNVDEKVAINYKAAIYRMVKEKHPELNGYDRAVEMEKLTTEKMLKSIDIDKVTKEIQKHLAEKMKNGESKVPDGEKKEKKASKAKSVKKVSKKSKAVSESSISTESSVGFSETSDY